MNRTELAHVIATVIHQHRLDGFTSRELAFAILDKAEPLIRTDERGKWLAYDEGVTRDEWAELRAKVRALPRSGIEIPYAKGVEHEYEMVRRADVLALIDGTSDE